MPPGALHVRKVKDMQIFRRKPGGTNSPLYDNHASNCCSCVGCTRGGWLPSRDTSLPLAGPHIHEVDVIGSASEADT